MIQLSGSLPAVTEDLTINGPGSSNLTISGGPSIRVFDLQAVTVGISNLRIINGDATGFGADGYGGAIRTSPSGTTLALTNMVFYNNSASIRGGAIYQPSGTITVLDSTFDSNHSTSFGGAVDQTNGVLIVTASTFSNNTSSGGGGLEIESISDTRLTNVTFSGNSAQESGGGISRIGTTNSLSLNNVTITNNIADSDNNGSGDGGGIYRGGGTVVVFNSVIAGNFDTSNNAGGGTIHPDCSGPLTSLGYNLLGRDDGCSGFTNGVNGDKVGTGANPIDALLGPLAANGGTTRTHALLPGSPAIDAGNPIVPGGGGFAACAATDQRNVGRPVGIQCDMGAYEAPVYPHIYLMLILR